MTTSSEFSNQNQRRAIMCAIINKDDDGQYKILVYSARSQEDKTVNTLLTSVGEYSDEAEGKAMVSGFLKTILGVQVDLDDKPYFDLPKLTDRVNTYGEIVIPVSSDIAVPEGYNFIPLSSAHAVLTYPQMKEAALNACRHLDVEPIIYTRKFSRDIK